MKSLLAVLLGSLVLGGAPVTGPTPGAPGVGDPYFPDDGNGGIDVLHYDIHDAYDFGTTRLHGYTRLTVDATQDLSRFDLDLLLPVSRVQVDGHAAAFRQTGDHELVITPAQPLRAGHQFRVTVRYDGLASRQQSHGERNWLANGGEVVAMNEPHMATWWFPANDHPLDRASVDVSITVPADKKVIANGVLVSRKQHGAMATTHWRAVEPMASYLAFFAAGHFQVAHGVDHGLPWYAAVSRQIEPSQRRSAMDLMKFSPDVVEWLASQLGPYPFSTTGGVVTALNPGFALENQTRPTYPVADRSDVRLIVHELSHQWFGDSVSVAHWQDVWLNEGFATFMEQRYAETHGGIPAQDWLTSTYTSLVNEPSFWSLRVDDPGRNHVFDYPVYARGGMAIQALRHRIGETAFWTLLQTWLATHHFGNGTVAEFEALATQVSGQDLTAFFHDWLDSTSRPDRTAANGLL